ncbi:MAG: plasmid recombination protein [bacterium]
MYDGKQVVRVETKYKQKDLYNIGNEMKIRKGTGNYDKERLEFNINYIDYKDKNLYQAVKQKLKNENIEYLNKKNTNVLNGITFTSGNEFFESLGMEFKTTDRIYQTGDKKGQYVKVPTINSNEDIPTSVKYYFDSCMDFLESYVGKNNIILAEVHFDEDTPHLQAYFIPVVDEVKRKKYDSNRVLLRDDNNKIIYESVKGNFLNNDQFWKNKGGKLSYSKMQDEFNTFIKNKGFNLDRGKVGNNKEHKPKLEYQVEETKAELNSLIKQKDNLTKDINSKKNTIIEINKNDEEDLLTPKKVLNHYSSKDIDKIITHSKEIKTINTIQKDELAEKDNIIEYLTVENNSFKNNNELVIRNKKIKELSSTIKEQKEKINNLNSIVNILESNIKDLKITVNKLKDTIFNIGKAICKVLKIKKKDGIDNYNDLADAINYDYYKQVTKKKDNDMER